MKYNNIIFLLVTFSLSSIIAQSKSDLTIRPQNPALRGMQYSHLTNDFYENNTGSMQLMVANEYVGSSISYFGETDNRFQFGLNAGIVPIVKNDVYSSEYYSQDEQYRLLLIPFWLTLKVRLRNNYNDKLIPYFIGGLGPTLGLDFGTNSGFMDSITYLRGQIGGGGYLGAGFDYLWAEEWAISMDVRYNIFAFDHPLGEDKEFSGFSIFVGFLRAFGL